MRILFDPGLKGNMEMRHKLFDSAQNSIISSLNKLGSIEDILNLSI